MENKTTNIPIALLGLGQVGRNFISLLLEKKELLKLEYGLDISLVAVADSSGAVIDRTGLDLKKIIDIKETKRKVNTYQDGESFIGTTLDAIEKSGATILVEASPTNLQNGEPAISHIAKSLQHKISVATLNKGPIVLKYPELAKIAQANNSQLKYSGATAAALPTSDVAFYSLAGTTISRIHGILNGTSNYILSEMYNGEIDLESAIKEAQEKGIAEHNPKADLEGWDTAAKTLILANTIMGAELSIDDIHVEGITGSTFEAVKSAKKAGGKVKLIGEIRSIEGKVEASVVLKQLTADHPLYNVEGTNKGIHYVTDTMGDLTVVGGKSDPRAAAAAALKDVILIATNK
ncbi:homoserine dehydrogenase [Aquibacillus kalidii]|uniref:homoserine dehydrogenase n=1 Tax=Aquibacillus kalidii TaxID=2762597 RepID=UPI001645A305|nr:homoserine dehydrogenase [Aquibacillus kalidii]